MSDPYGVNRGGAGWGSRLRRDLRPINDPATAAGLRGVHRDLRGNVIGGYTAEGVALGTKRRAGRGYGLSAEELAQLPAPGAVTEPGAEAPAGSISPPPARPEGNALGGGLAAWRALNPHAMSAQARLRKENPAAAAAARARAEKRRQGQREWDKEQMRGAGQMWA